MKRTICLLMVTGFVTQLQLADAADIRQVSAQACSDCNTGGWSGDCCTDAGCCDEGCQSRRCRDKRCESCNYCDDSGRRCNFRSKTRDFGLNWTGECGPIGRSARRCKCARCVKYMCDTKAFPDSGWAPPAHTPIRRTGGQYTSYYPNNWYGSPGGGFGPAAPMVYQPTDTAQQGYSYAHVPRWRPNPGMIPPVPSPSNFHARFCPPAGGCSSHAVMPEPCYGDCMMNGGMIMGHNAGRLPQGYVSYTPGRRQQPAAFASQAKTPNPQPLPTATKPRPISPVSNTQTLKPQPAARPAVAVTLPEILDTPAIETKSVQRPKATKPAVTSTPQPKTTAPTKTQNRNAGRRGSAPRSTQSRNNVSRGWLGLPSLSEMRLEFN